MTFKSEGTSSDRSKVVDMSELEGWKERRGWWVEERKRRIGLVEFYIAQVHKGRVPTSVGSC